MKEEEQQQQQKLDSSLGSLEEFSVTKAPVRKGTTIESFQADEIEKANSNNAVVMSVEKQLVAAPALFHQTTTYHHHEGFSQAPPQQQQQQQQKQKQLPVEVPSKQQIRNQNRASLTERRLENSFISGNKQQAFAQKKKRRSKDRKTGKNTSLSNAPAIDEEEGKEGQEDSEKIQPGAIRVAGIDGIYDPDSVNRGFEDSFSPSRNQQQTRNNDDGRPYFDQSGNISLMPIVAQEVELKPEPPLVTAAPIFDYDEEEISRGKKENEQNKNQRRSYWKYFLATCLVVIIIVLLVVLIPRRSNNNNNNNNNINNITAVPTLSPTYTPQVDAVFQVISNALGHEQVYISGSVFQQAAFWMMDSDPLQLSIDEEIDNRMPTIDQQQQEQNSTETSSGKSLNDIFIQRYCLVLFYFMAGPWRTCNPLSSPLSSTMTTENQASASSSVLIQSSFCLFDRLRRESDNDFVYETQNATRWLSATHECEWVGIQCRDNDNVENMRLFGFEATGTLPTELGLLSHMKVLRLTHNLFSGSIPTEYGLSLWPGLNQLDLQNNTLTGNLPTTLWNRTLLRGLNVGNNRLDGTIATEIGKLSNLVSLHLFENDFSGTLPSELGQARVLATFRAHENAFVGTIPKEIFISKILLGELWLNNNAFSGPIPTEIGSVAFLSDLRLSSNQLTGSIPTTLFDLNRLFRLDLEFNQLQGRLDTMPWSKFTTTPLRLLRLRENKITGSIPTILGSLTRLVELQLGRNFLTGTIPTEIGRICNLRLVTLHYNRLMGTMPSQVCALRQPFRLRILQSDCAGSGVNGTGMVECADDCCTSCCDPVLEECRVNTVPLTVLNRCTEEFSDQRLWLECIEEGRGIGDEESDSDLSEVLTSSCQ